MRISHGWHRERGIRGRCEGGGEDIDRRPPERGRVVVVEDECRESDMRDKCEVHGSPKANTVNPETRNENHTSKQEQGSHNRALATTRVVLVP